ncbi:MAG: cellulase family glycosylhydrolase [Chitinophagaceae bacterium]|nr:cellulase family glycosylhydrolase [Chitinophagaceae bacterium]
MKRILIAFIVSFAIIAGCNAPETKSSTIWTKEQANDWYSKEPWRVGADFLPSTAINQLEMWQAATFDTATINKELGWASSIGMNTMRVYLHDLAWKADAEGFKKRIDKYLEIASRNNIKTVFTIFDDCWNPDPEIGKQPEPKPGIHNSGWVRSPSKTVHNDSTQWAYLEKYVKDILTTFKDDNRIYLWDLYNEPGNSDYGLTSLPLLQNVFKWAWAVRPSQPVSAGVWFMKYPELNKYQLENSDVITFHNYEDTTSLKEAIDSLKQFGRPLICTEYMARTRNSRFQTHLPILKRYNVAAINWGLVSGKSNTIFAWDSPMPDSTEPAVWFHDIFRKDGTPYDSSEVKTIRDLTNK